MHEPEKQGTSTTALFAGEVGWQSVRETLRSAVPDDAGRLGEWLALRPWRDRFSAYLVGSLLDQETARDLDLALCAGARPAAGDDAARAMREIRRFGILELGIRIDSTAYPMPQEEVMRRAHDGMVFSAWKLRTAYWEKRYAAGDSGLTLAGELVVINRRLSQTRYYDKLPAVEAQGARERRLRPGRLLMPAPPSMRT